MSDGQSVHTLEELEEKNDDFRSRYDSKGLSKEERRTLVGNLHAFLRKCALHGRYMPTGTLERRGLRNMVDYWRSRLESDEYPEGGIPELEPYDPDAGVPLYEPCPYPGLEPYDDKSKADFFGRETLANDYADKLEAQGVFLIIGGSGSGKSSVALAGVGPACKVRYPDWHVRSFKPGSDPLGALAGNIAGATNTEKLADQLKQRPESAASLLGGALDHRPALLIIDQFEEVLTLCRDADAQKAFADALLALAPPDMGAAERRFYLLFTLRDDHQGRFGSNPNLKLLHDRLMMPDRNVNLPSMQPDEILQAILKPAQRVRLRFVPADVAVKLAWQTASLMNGLPLLQFALQRLWWEDRDPKQEDKGRPRDFISEAQLKSLPDVSSALGKHAEHVYQELDSPQKKKICERLILELLFLDDNFTEPVRRRRPVGDLRKVIGRALGASADEVDDVIQTFVDQRLLRRFTERGEDQLEVAHEALLRHWETIRELVFGDEMKARLFRIKEVQKEAAEWKKNECGEGWLKQRGEPLKKAKKDVDEFFLFDEDSRKYVMACVDWEKKWEKEKEEAEDKRKWKLGAIAVALVALAGTSYLSSLKNTNLGAIASLGERLQPWDGLDVAYSLALSSKDYRVALGHALERMDGARMLGERDLSLSLLGDGAALLQIAPAGEAGDRLLLYRVAPTHANERGRDWLPNGLGIELGGKYRAGALGKEIKSGTHSGKHLLVVMFQRKDKALLQTWLIDWGKGEARKVGGEKDMTDLRPFSSLASRPDGLEVKWAFADAGRTEGELLTVGMDEDPKATKINDSNALINALAYLPTGAAQANFVAASGARLHCGDPLSARGSAEGGAIDRIVPVPGTQLFVVGSANGKIELANCDGIIDKNPGFRSGNPESLRISPDEAVNAVLSYQTPGGGFQCYSIAKDGVAKEVPCNGNHPVGDMALLDVSSQVVIEQKGLPVARSYPAEFSVKIGQKFPSLPVQWRGNYVLCPGEEPSRIGERDLRNCGDAATPSVAEALSFRGKYFARMTEDGKGMKISVRDVDAPQDGKEWRKDYYGLRAFAVDDGGKVAFFKLVEVVAKDKNKKLVPYLFVDGDKVEVPLGEAQPSCLAFSPGEKSESKYLVIGTSSGLAFRVNVAGSVLPLPSKVKIEKDVTVSAEVVACAIADDGAVALGLRDGNVMYAAGSNGEMDVLTEKAVYGFSTAVRAVRIDGEGDSRRVAALGSWQFSNCVFPALPGQAIRAWEMDDGRKGKPPVSVACFPNEPILALGGWKDKENNKAVGIKLLTLLGERWHACPACRLNEESEGGTADRLIEKAKMKGAKPLDDDALARRYGFKLGLW